ncbi:UDP-glucose 4-epimerase family protein [Marinobacter adhaerens]|uniref:UDP-glucose 4-epimerase family protein n=1 Tax=Marinobacter adhaerens TaxID=1033846 RepID=UPI003BA846F2
MSKVCVTGGTGFVGSRLVEKLKCHGYTVVAPVRSQNSEADGPVVGDIDGQTDWISVLPDVDTIIHCAGRAHIMNDNSSDPLSEFRKINVEGTLNLARQAIAAGVRRFVFLSSIKVNGELTSGGEVFRESDTPKPSDPYGISKLEAEIGLLELARHTDLEVVIVRPPLVYGPGAKGNFASMLRLVKKHIPLPLGAVRNKRSLVALDNLIDLIITCVEHPAAINQVFLVSDGDDLSTTELLRAVARAMGKSSRLLPIPADVLMIGAAVLGKKAVAQRLLGSLQVDISKARDLLDWEPPLSLEEGLFKAVERHVD